MMYYQKECYLTGQRGNNAFSYNERTKAGREAKLFLPALRTVLTYEDVCIGKHVVFEEMEDGILRSCIGLEYLYLFPYRDIPVYVMDNHNQALYCWIHEYNKQGWTEGAELYHIDQHKDMRDPVVYLLPEQIRDEQKVAEYVHEVLNVGNFIVPAMKANVVGTIHMMDHSAAFQKTFNISKDKPMIVDIDLDIFCEELSFYNFPNIIEKTKELMKQASVITIATSPYFIDQKRALSYLAQLFA